MRGLLACLLVLPPVAGCGAAAPAARASYGSYGSAVAGDSAIDDGRYELSNGLEQEARSPRFAQASSGPATDVASDASASDTPSQPLLVYRATLAMAVHQIAARQDQVETIARERGGFLASRTNDTIVVRVPARAFEEAMAQIRELGDVLARNVEVQDVTEEFRDVETRIRTLEAMRQRVEQLLQQATNVQAALAVEEHLERITVQLEQLRGRLRFLSDRVAFSTITVQFRERADAQAPHFELPFRWLRQVGLQRLLRL